MHNLATNARTGKASMVATRSLPWHRLGEFKDDYITSKECIEAAGLDFKVEKRPMYTDISELMGPGFMDDLSKIMNSSGVSNPSPENLEQALEQMGLVKDKDVMKTVRTDTLDRLGTVGRGYGIVQNTEAFEFFDKICGKNAAVYETAGALGKGETVWISAKLPNHIKVKVNGKLDVTEERLLLANSHDGSGALKVIFTPTRVVCSNTLQMALSKFQNGISIRHTSNIKERLMQADEVLGIVNQEYVKTSEVYQRLADIKITDRQLRKYIDKIFPVKGETEEVSTRLSNIRTEVFEYSMEGAGQQMAAGTAWGAYNGITGYFQNVRNYRDMDAMIKSNILGDSSKKMKKALKLALDLG